MSALFLEYWCEGPDLLIYAQIDNYEKEITLKGQAKAIMASFKTIYDLLEEKPTDKADELQARLQTLSTQLLAPFAQQIQQCSLVRFIVYDDLIRAALDLLLHDGDYLFLQKPVCYQIDEGAGEDEARLTLESALLIADLTADPEEACKAVAELIPDARYVEAKAASVRMIEQAADQVDVLVVSAHGEIDKHNRGTFYLTDNDDDDGISPRVIGQIEAWITYFDSCQQGANLAFLQAFQEQSDAQFYLAPLVSNDAGDSSTKTMTWFFTAVLRHGNPIRALFETRKRLFEFYHSQAKLNRVTTLNKAFVFRIFEFVGE